MRSRGACFTTAVSLKALCPAQRLSKERAMLPIIRTVTKLVVAIAGPAPKQVSRQARWQVRSVVWQYALHLPSEMTPHRRGNAEHVRTERAERETTRAYWP